MVEFRIIAKVVPIHKKGKLSEFSNYRPISVLPALSKIYERLIYNRILEFFDKHEIFSNNQFGFRNKYSTSHAINSLVNQFQDSVENNQFMFGSFIDLSPALHTQYCIKVLLTNYINMVYEALLLSG
jgi:hypothetical protein